MRNGRAVRYFTTFIITIALAGCQVDLTSDLYSQDIFDDENLTFPSRAAVEVPSCNSDRVNEMADEILAVFSEPSEASISGCERKGMDSMLHVDFKSELANESSSYDITVFRSEGDNGFTNLQIVINQNFKTRINQLMSKQMQSLEYSDLELSFVINNDLRESVDYYLPSGWINGEPRQYAGGILERRERVRVTSPDSISALAIEGKQPDFIALRKSPE